MATISAASRVVNFDASAGRQVDKPRLPLDGFDDSIIVAHIYDFRIAAAPYRRLQQLSPSISNAASSTIISHASGALFPHSSPPCSV